MESKINNQNKILLSIFFILCTIILAHSILEEPSIERFEGVFVGYIDMYLNGHIQLDNFQLMPLLESNIPAGHSLPLRTQGIVESESYLPGFISLFLILHYISGISPQLLIILPIGLLFVPIIYICIIRSFNFSKNCRYVYLLTIILYIVFLSTTRYYGSFYVAPPAIMLFLTIFFCIIKILENSLLRSHFFLISIICTLSLSQYWHTPTMWILYLVISLCIAIGIFYILSKILRTYCVCFEKNNLLRNSVYLVISISIVILTFIHLWQNQYLDQFINNNTDFISLLSQKLFAKNPFPVPYAYNYKNFFLGQIYYFAYLLSLVLSSLMIIVPGIFLFLRSKAEHRLDVNLSLIFVVSVILSQIVATLSYSQSNSIGFPLIPLLLPLLSVWLFSDLDKKYRILNRINFNLFLHSMLIILIILNATCSVCLLLTNQAGTNSETKYNNVEECFQWLYSDAPRNKDLIVDFNILGLFLQHEAKTNNLSFSYVDLSPATYEVLVGDENNVPSALRGNYVVVDHATMMEGLPIHTTSARAMLIPEWNRIDGCAKQDKLYSDSHLSVFIFK